MILIVAGCKVKQIGWRMTNDERATNDEIRMTKSRLSETPSSAAGLPRAPIPFSPRTFTPAPLRIYLLPSSPGRGAGGEGGRQNAFTIRLPVSRAGVVSFVRPPFVASIER